MSKGEVGKTDIREVEEVGIGVLICEEGIVERGGIYNREYGICEDVVVVWGVWGTDETGGEEGMVGLKNYANTNGSLEVSSIIGFKFKWEKEDWGNKAS